MTPVIIGIAAGLMLGMALVMTYVLGWASKKFHVDINPKVEAVLEALPGVNCGGCGFLGCSEYAVAIAIDGAPVNKCSVGGKRCAEALAGIMGVDAGSTLQFKAIVYCGAFRKHRLSRTEYRGEYRCNTAHLVAGIQGCTFGCIGFGDCVRACNYEAIHIVSGLATVDYDRCVGCRACEKVCPRKIISIQGLSSDSIPVVACSNQDPGKQAMAVCEHACIACRACTRSSDLFEVVDNLARCDHTRYENQEKDNVLKAVEKCPTQCICFRGKDL